VRRVGWVEGGLLLVAARVELMLPRPLLVARQEAAELAVRSSPTAQIFRRPRSRLAFFARCVQSLAPPAPLSASPPRSASFKQDLMYVPGVGMTMWLAGYVPVKRGDKASGAR